MPVNRDGFSLNASVSCQPHQRDRLERLCRYITRLPLALDRLTTGYHGVLAPNAKYRKLVVPTPNRQAKKKRKHTAHAESQPAVENDPPLAPLSCAERLKRVFKLDIEHCPKCGGRLRVIAAVTTPDVIRKILDHVHQQQAPPGKPPARVSGPITSKIQFDAM
ncbi:MAG: hypothetical protein GXP16_20165 [Gammaproteobacteria bacterium]|nr:hypothetical protein [Gammaproteobacteria bacterium]